jgi:tRNA G18 (ribose-2'-O)-methylase SpoU
MILIEDSADERIKEFTMLRESTLLSRGLALVESEKIFFKLIHNNIHIHKVLCLESFAIKHNLNSDNTYICDRKILDSISGFKTEFDVIALFTKPNDVNLNLLDKKIIALNGLTSPENVGSIVRTAAAFNVNSLISDNKTCSPFLRRCIRVSMGNIFSLKTHHSKNFKDDLLELKKLGYLVFATANIKGAIDYTNFHFPEKSVLVIGSEGHGIDKEILNVADSILYIPINENVAHLNASNAASIFLSRFN